MMTTGRHFLPGRIFEKSRHSDVEDRVGKIRLWTHFWTSRAVWRRCIDIKVLPRAIRPKLVVIWTPGDLFRGIFALQDLMITRKLECSRGRSLTFSHSMRVFSTPNPVSSHWNRTEQASEALIETSVDQTVSILSSVDRKVIRTLTDSWETVGFKGLVPLFIPGTWV